ncbi:biotin biosynthesis protein BioY [Bifidobacterium thermophilum]|uniref:Biotin transporter n=1 Tax=Bifidobacterium thermophilum TaxID=33905 RepID=A0A2N3QGZ1_9BIFI|nr:biotin transporter BioY [Bifidobacterium thermophilum]PKU90543.1 biotin biosynthesis protein BioY [Bifidobacterium thermophilum]
MSHQTPSAALASAAPTTARRLLRSAGMSLLFALLLWAAAAAGRIPIPGTPVGITLQTFVLMLAALSLDWREAGGAVVLYLLAGVAGLPVFSGGMSTLALVGPSAGFLFGFLPGVIVASLLKGKARGTGARGYWLTAARYFGASLVGCVVIVYAFGVSIQAMLTHVPLSAVALASLGFAGGDLLKAVVASAAVSGLSSRIARDAK